MDPTVEQILAEYERRSANEAKIMHSQPGGFARRIDDFLLSVGPPTGRMLHLLAIGANAKSILELGPHTATRRSGSPMPRARRAARS
jgi:predicted O-methyltransferase YrrM